MPACGPSGRLGVGAVISGEFYGWNFGLGTGGFGGLLIAAVLMAVMYYGLVYSIAEMSPALPHTGGAYSFARSAMGPWGGFLTGLAENMEYVITPAVVVGAMGLLMQQIIVGLFTPADFDGRSRRRRTWWNSLPFWWAVFYVIFVGINIIGIEATMRFTVTITVLSIAVLRLLLPRGDLLREARLLPVDEHLEGRDADPGRRWFVVAVRVQRDLQVLTVRDLVLPRDRGSAARRGGVDGPAPRRPQRLGLGDAHAADRGDPDVGHQHGAPGRGLPVRPSGFPLLDGFYAIFGKGSAADLLGLLFMIGLVASFFTIIFAYGRNTYSLSRAGYFPKFLSKTHGDAEDAARRA